ncbi:MAG: hypothetical protein PHC28_13200 [Flavobacterium sp.]|uniref:hypothetical protein n=1 Tax=Flavobacterium sp. TaxID=239 RepID=UPI002636ECDA|nr:hypothetical protein [Flavobacterium sp.]MDD5151408.1 hypothetical protein [Flavobacterium sp.]
MDTNTISISNRVVFLDETRGFSRFFKAKFSWISNVERYFKIKDFVAITVNETDILFIVMTTPNDFMFYTGYANKVKYVFIYMDYKDIVIEQKLKNNIFLIDMNWLKQDVVNYIRKCTENIN